MHIKFLLLSRAAALLAAGVVLAGTLPGVAAAAEPLQDRSAARAQHRKEWVRAKLERSANRLEIRASQQAAWQDYVNARLALADGHVAGLPGDRDPAAMVRLRADRAADGARKLAVFADATAKLEETLSPEQRLTLAQMMRRADHGRFGLGHRGRAERARMEHDGQEHGSAQGEGPVQSSTVEPDRRGPAA